MDPLSQGRELYRQKDYPGAVKAFTKAIEISSDHLLLTALDHRAASYEKLGNLKAGLRDAKEMIDLQPDCSKGYLRCAKVLQLKGETELALKIYERGLQKVKINKDDDRTLLQHMFNKLKSKQSPSKCFDPLVMLPTELAEMVTFNLNIRDRVICLAVSKSWKRFLESYHELWTTLDLRRVKTTIGKLSLKAHLRRSNYGLLSAFLNMDKFSPGKLKELAIKCTQLNYLEIDEGFLGQSLVDALPFTNNLRSIIISPGCKISLNFVLKSLILCPKLEVAEFHGISGLGPNDARFLDPWPQLDCLRTIKLLLSRESHANASSLNLEVLIQSSPNVENASLKGWILMHESNDPFDFSGWTKLKNLEITHMKVFQIPILPKTLQLLDLSSTYKIGSFLHIPSEDSLIELPQLETFKCSNCTVLTFARAFGLARTSMKAGNLKTLHIDNLSDFVAGGVVTLIFPPCDSLEALSYVGSAHSEDQIVQNVLQYPKLKYLDVSYTKITGYGVKQILNGLSGPLEYLGVRNCDNLAHDAITYAQARGAKVSYISQSGSAFQSYRDMVGASGF